MPMMLDIGLTVAVKLGSAQLEPAEQALLKTPVGPIFSVPQAHRTLVVLYLTQAPLPTMEPIGIEPPALFRHFTQPQPAVLMDLTTIAYKLDALMCLQTAEAQQPPVKYEYCSQTDTPTRVQ
jgi:hypothetical protein